MASSQLSSKMHFGWMSSSWTGDKFRQLPAIAAICASCSISALERVAMNEWTERIFASHWPHHMNELAARHFGSVPVDRCCRDSRVEGSIRPKTGASNCWHLSRQWPCWEWSSWPTPTTELQHVLLFPLIRRRSKSVYSWPFYQPPNLRDKFNV